VLPVERDAAPVGRPRVDERAEVELLGHGPGEGCHEVPVAAADGDHDATRPRRVEASMYLRDTGERSSGGQIAAVHTKDERPVAGAELRAERARHAEAHGGVVALREVAPAALDAHVEAGEEHVA